MVLLYWFWLPFVQFPWRFGKIKKSTMAVTWQSWPYCHVIWRQHFKVDIFKRTIYPPTFTVIAFTLVKLWGWWNTQSPPPGPQKPNKSLVCKWVKVKLVKLKTPFSRSLLIVFVVVVFWGRGCLFGLFFFFKFSKMKLIVILFTWSQKFSGAGSRDELKISFERPKDLTILILPNRVNFRLFQIFKVLSKTSNFS